MGAQGFDYQTRRLQTRQNNFIKFTKTDIFLDNILHTQAVLTKANAKLVNIATKVTTFAVRSSAHALWGTLGHNLRTRRFQKCLGQRPWSPVTPAWSSRRPRPMLTIKVMIVTSQSPLMAKIAEKRLVLVVIFCFSQFCPNI